MTVTKQGPFSENEWTNAIYDIRTIFLPNSKRGAASAQKLILFQIAAAGIPSPSRPSAGYMLRLDILAKQVAMDKSTVKEHISALESMDLLTSKNTGPNRPKLRVVNWRELRRVARAQRKDFEAWYEANSQIGEDQPIAVYVPSKYHIKDSSAWVGPSSTSLDTRLDTHLDAPLGAHSVTNSVSISETIRQPSDSFEPVETDCISLHGRDLTCNECLVPKELINESSPKVHDPWSD